MSGLHTQSYSNSTNYVVVVFKVLKDCTFDRVLAYINTQLLDFLYDTIYI